MSTSYQHQLTGGHPNSLGNTVAVVEDVLAHPERMEELFNCYFREDEVVRLRTSNACKRIAKAKPEIIIPYLDLFLTEVAKINQASAQWTLAQLLLILDKFTTSEQEKQALPILKRNLLENEDWIVLNASMETLKHYTSKYPEIKTWFVPQLEELARDKRKSVARRAQKYLTELEK